VIKRSREILPLKIILDRFNNFKLSPSCYEEQLAALLNLILLLLAFVDTEI
jgi:hypothetical protein